MVPPQDGEKYPVILTGDGCYRNLESDSVEEMHKRGFIAASFNRLDFANDIKGSREGGFTIFTKVIILHLFFVCGIATVIFPLFF